MSTPTLWYYHKDDRGFGPVEEADIRGLLEHNEIAADTLVWRDGLGDWTEAKDTELSSFFSDAGSPSPSISVMPQSQRKDKAPPAVETEEHLREKEVADGVRFGSGTPSKVSWFAFLLAEIFNCLIFGVIPLFVALVLGVGSAIISR
jgi:GYF domain 2